MAYEAINGTRISPRQRKLIYRFQDYYGCWVDWKPIKMVESFLANLLSRFQQVLNCANLTQTMFSLLFERSRHSFTCDDHMQQEKAKFCIILALF